MRIALNLATSPLHNNRRFLLTTLTAGVIAFGALGVLGTHTVREWRQSRDLRNEISALQGEINELLAERHDLEEFFKDKETARKMERAELMNKMILQRSFGWTKMFTDLENLLPTGVRVVSVEPRMDGERVAVKLVVGAVSDDEKVKFLEALEGSKSFTSVQALGETRPNRQGESDKVLLELQAYYRMGAE